MRQVTSLASAYDRKRLPASLVQRLELMQHSALATQSNAQLRQHRRGPGRGAHAIVLAWFSLGVIASGALGAGAVVAMRAQAAGGAPLASIAGLVSTDWIAWAKAPPAAAAPEPGPAWDTVQVAMRRAERAPLPLQVTGADGAAIELIIDGLPAGVRPSRGTRRGQAWVLGRGDLDGLSLVLDGTAPAAFDVRIALSAPPGATASGSIVQVRLADAVVAEPVAAAHAARPSGIAPGISDGPPAVSAAFGEVAAPADETVRTSVLRDRARSGREAAASPKRAAAAAAGADASVRRPLPEGASALGAVSRQPDAPPWWQMPPPSWSPFVVGQERP
jgi:hypothetical protein